ncbi:MAG: hypothetical protein EOO46_11795 [Flavobacterium sp.]|nr:MAG: hypothetical protein EOO46_11795 [Flavobacterium sp.]
MDNTSQILLNISNGEKSGIISFNEDKSRITYHCNRDYSANFKNPEEKVRASYFSELVLTYQYPKNRIDIEIVVPRRTPEDRADIVVYSDDECKDPYLIVECKKEGVTDAEFKQAIEQAFGNANSLRAKYAAVIAGNTKTAFDVSGFKPNEREKNVIADIPIRYGKAPLYKYIKGDKIKDLKVVSREDLISALEKCHDTVWQGGKLAPTTAFDEVSKLLFCKMKDEKDGTRRNEPYRFQIGTHETAYEVAKRIDEIYQEAKKQDEEVFKEDIRLEPKVIYSVVEHLQGLALNKTDLDTKGVAFEKFMVDYFKGKMGQFFTPRPIIDFAVKLLAPKHTDLVIDPSCGSGGFLLASLDVVRHKAIADYGAEEGHDIWHTFAKKNLYGIEINDQIARICKMNMIIHDDGHTNIISADSLDFFKNIKKTHKGFKENHFDLLLANPPFGAIVKKVEKEEKYLDQYKLGEDRQNQKTEILFIERCIDFLKEGTGRMGLVLPDGILTNSSLSYVRELLLERCQILAIVSLPQFAFTHFGAGVKSSLVFARKKLPNEATLDYPIFMAMADRIGYDATGREDFNELIELNNEFEVFRKDTSVYKPSEKFQGNVFITKRSDLKNRFDVYFYKPAFIEIDKLFQGLAFKTIAEISLKVSSGATPKAKGEAYVEEGQGGVPFIRSGDINFDDKIDFNSVLYIKEDVHQNQLKSSQLQKGDLLIAIVGATIGQVAVYTDDRIANINQALALVRLDKSKANPQYVKLYFLTHLGQAELDRLKRPVARANINLDEIRSIRIVLPPLEKQMEFIAIWEKALNEKTELERKANQILNEAKDQIEKRILR